MTIKLEKAQGTNAKNRFQFRKRKTLVSVYTNRKRDIAKQKRESTPMKTVS